MTFLCDTSQKRDEHVEARRLPPSLVDHGCIFPPHQQHRHAGDQVCPGPSPGGELQQTAVLGCVQQGTALWNVQIKYYVEQTCLSL
uniref:Uncharacterized protein n=1 Tax=Salmo trutta TaxID=8032 RepID=A0A673ZXX7_SALTR